ncbi:MAG: hypothetical protein AAF927_25095 [Bacteroidota bacterium]
MKALFFTLALLIGSQLWGQNPKVELNWKIAPAEPLSYQTIMDPIDSSKVDFKVDDVFPDSEESNMEAQKMLQKLNKAFESINKVSVLSAGDDGNIDVKIIANIDTSMTSGDSLLEAAEMAKNFLALNEGVMLRGSIHPQGDIHSFWLKTKQKNLLALLFELPTQAVAEGDVWSLEVNFILNDQNFICDSAIQINQIQLLELREDEGETIAVLKYNLYEYVKGEFNNPFSGMIPTMMSFTYQGIAEFSVDKGRWKSFDGLLGVKASGVMDANTQQVVSLIPIE